MEEHPRAGEAARGEKVIPVAKEAGNDMSYVHSERGAGRGGSDDLGRRDRDGAANFAAEAGSETKRIPQLSPAPNAEQAS